MSKLSRSDIAAEFTGPAKAYPPKTPIEGVRFHRLTRRVDDRGFFMEVFRSRASGSHGAALAEFWSGVDAAQLNYSVVNSENHVKGLHYHLEQEDIWFCPPP